PTSSTLLAPAPSHSTSSFHYTPPTATYPLSLHDALPIYRARIFRPHLLVAALEGERLAVVRRQSGKRKEIVIAVPERLLLESPRSEEHTSELQSLTNLVCRLLLEKKKRGIPAPRTPPHQH